MKTKTKEFTVNGRRYIFQRPPFSEIGRITDAAKDSNGRIVPLKMYKLMMEHVIVSPRVDFRYFDEVEPVKEKKICPNETEYTLVYPGAKKIAEIEYESLDENEVPSEAKIHENLLRHIIRVDGSPVDFEFFENLEDDSEFFIVMDEAADFFRSNEFSQVMKAAISFFRGKKV